MEGPAELSGLTFVVGDDGMADSASERRVRKGRNKAGSLSAKYSTYIPYFSIFSGSRIRNRKLSSKPKGLDRRSFCSSNIHSWQK